MRQQDIPAGKHYQEHFAGMDSILLNYDRSIGFIGI
jgi:hypothetical protein